MTVLEQWQDRPGEEPTPFVVIMERLDQWLLVCNPRFTYALARELGQRGIQCIIEYPGFGTDDIIRTEKTWAKDLLEAVAREAMKLSLVRPRRP